MDAFDREMQADEARFTENNSLLAMSEEERKALYKSTNPLQALAERNKVQTISMAERRRRLCSPTTHSMGTELYDVDDPLTYLSKTQESEVLPSERDERVLAKEYTLERTFQIAQRILAEEDGGKEGANTETKQALKVCKDRELDAAYRTQLYELAKARQPNSSGSGNQTENLESKLPGPYLSFDSPGRYTRYEAIANRMPAHRSASSIMDRDKSSAKGRRSKHYPAASKKKAAAGGGAGEQTPQDLQHVSSLYRWQHSMGLAATADAPGSAAAVEQ